MVAAALRQAFLQPDRTTAGQTWRQVVGQLRPRWPKLASLIDESEHDVLAYLSFPSQHWAIHGQTAMAVSFKVQSQEALERYTARTDWSG